MAQQNIPNFQFSGFYYFDILRDITRFLRINVPEITSEDDEEPYEQIKRAWALAHHIMNTRLDIVANETYLQTARKLESVRLQLKLIDYELRAATPATTDLVMKFSSLFTSTTLIVPQNSQFGTVSDEATDQIIYEAVQDNIITRTDRLAAVFQNLAVAITLTNKNGNLFDYSSTKVPQEGDVINQGGNRVIVTEVVDADTIRVNNGALLANGDALLSTSNHGADKSGQAATAGLTFDFGLTEPQPEDQLYFMHDTAMWDQIAFTVTQAYKTGISGVWEFFDSSLEDENPDSVTNLGPNLEFDLTTLLGTADRSGTKVTISYAPTSAQEEAISVFEGGVNKVKTTGLLGQSAPSLTASDYLAGTLWHPLEGVSDGTVSDGSFSQNGALNYTLPQTLKRDWAKATINARNGFFLRFRVQTVTKTAATMVGTDLNLVGLDSNNYRINLKIDGFADTEIDVTGDAGASPGTYVLGDIVNNINTALAGVSASLANVASNVGGQLGLTAPDDDLGKDSLIRISAPTGQDATNELFGLSESEHPHEYIGIGGVPTIDLARIDEGSQYLKFAVVQGATVEETPLGSSNGAPNQEMVLGFAPLIEGTLTIEVNEGSGFTQYDEVDNFLNSDGTSKHYTLDVTADDEATIEFGDGTNGKIPPAGVDNVRATYRIGADQDGNVGANSITVNLAGVSFVDSITNPRGATGWAARQGSTAESLALAKVEGPASLRTLGKAITPTDIETLAIAFVSPSTGASPIVRAQAIEETFGVKTIELLAVGSSGNLLSESQREEIDEYFNGNKDAGVEGVLVTNHEVTTVNYTPKVIDIQAELTGGSIAAVENALITLLNPEAKLSNGVTFRWGFGGLIPRSIIIAAIHDADSSITKVNLIAPAVDVQLGARELPLAGTLTITNV